MTATPRTLLRLLALALLGAPLAAQEREPYVEDPDHARREPSPHGQGPDDAFEFALGGDALWAAYRNGFRRGPGYAQLGLLVNEDDDVAVLGRLLRFGEPSADVPLGLGVGLGLFGAIVDVPDSEVGAITLTGAADYTFELTYPVRLTFELSYAPDLATFGDGTRVLDVLGRVEADLSSWATGFVGYRHLELDLRDEDDPELDSALHVGVRLGF